MYNPKYPSGTGATAAIAGHPLHPILVTIPIAALVGACVADWLFFSTGNGFWALAAYWMLLSGLAVGLLAAITGVIDLLSVERARTMGIGWAHGIGNVIALALTLGNFLIRRDNPEVPPFPQGLILSTVVFAILVVTGWLGGELAFRHGVGVSRGVGGHSQTENPDLTPSGRLDEGKS
jgi:uncharacterized membrane protein